METPPPGVAFLLVCPRSSPPPRRISTARQRPTAGSDFGAPRCTSALSIPQSAVDRLVLLIRFWHPELTLARPARPGNPEPPPFIPNPPRFGWVLA